VNPGPVTIAGIDVQYLTPDTVRLTAVMDDPSMLHTPGLKFVWWLSAPPPPAPPGVVVPPPVIKYGNDPQADSVEVVFYEAGDYQFTAKATDDSGEIVESPPQAITLAQIPTKVMVVPPAFGIAPAQQQQLSATVDDQLATQYSPRRRSPGRW
jgi:hypothetical protein